MRIRTIKPEWLEDEKLAAAGDEARILSVSLILLADDYGNGRAHEMFLASRVWPYGDSLEVLAKVSGGFRELLEIGFVAAYEVKGQKYYHVCNWSKHQKVSHPGKPLVPPPPEGLGRSSRESPEGLAPDPDHDPDLDQDPDQSTDGNGRALSWQRSLGVIAEVAGIDMATVSAANWQTEARAILRLCGGDEGTLRRVTATWIADEWVAKERPLFGHLAKHWPKYANATPAKRKKSIQERFESEVEIDS